MTGPSSGNTAGEGEEAAEIPPGYEEKALDDGCRNTDAKETENMEKLLGQTEKNQTYGKTNMFEIEKNMAQTAQAGSDVVIS